MYEQVDSEVCIRSRDNQHIQAERGSDIGRSVSEAGSVTMVNRTGNIQQGGDGGVQNMISSMSDALKDVMTAAMQSIQQGVVSAIQSTVQTSTDRHHEETRVRHGDMNDNHPHSLAANPDARSPGHIGRPRQISMTWRNQDQRGIAISHLTDRRSIHHKTNDTTGERGPTGMRRMTDTTMTVASSLGGQRHQLNEQT